MIQKARSSDSRSFLRELELALVLIEKESDRLYFLNKLSEVNNKRNESDKTHTGERAVKSEILTYLKQKGNPQTANVWCRSISYQKQDIENLLRILQTNLKQNGIEGILEIHLQDREINSPHIQFVGNNADKAELIIAKVLCALKYETSLESAMSKKIDFEPYWKKNKLAKYPKKNELKDTMKIVQEYNRERNTPKAIDDFINECEEKFAKIKENIKKQALQFDAINKEIQKREMQRKANPFLLRMKNRRLRRSRR